MKKRLGFTLIELLAVIVILAIIALIATPIILNIIEKARKSAFKDSAYGLIEAAKLQYVQGILDGSNSAATYTFDGTNDSGLEFSGSAPEGGQVVVDSEGNVGIAIYNNGMCALKGTKESTVRLIEYDASTCIVPDAALDPVITLNGDKEVILHQGETYAEQGVEAKTVDGTDLTYTTTITKDGNVVTSVDTSTVGEYEITYTTEVSNSKTATETRKVTILKAYICKRATTLHTETCSLTDSTYYCSGAGYTASNKGTTITYGNENVTAGTLTSGDAYDCDVNGDGIYDATTERFYYVSDYYNTRTKTYDSNYAVFIYYSNIKDATPNSTSTVAYDSNDGYVGPVSAIKNLPTTDQWKNVQLVNTVRTILTNMGTTSACGTALPSNFSYSGYAARLLTIQEVESACQVTSSSLTDTDGSLDVCNYLMENTSYAIGSSGKSYWLESISYNTCPCAITVNRSRRRLDRSTGSQEAISLYYGVRPAIEVLKTDIEI